MKLEEKNKNKTILQNKKKRKTESNCNNQFLCYNCNIIMNEDNIENQKAWITCENCEAWFCTSCHTHNMNSTKSFICNYCVTE